MENIISNVIRWVRGLMNKRKIYVADEPCEKYVCNNCGKVFLGLEGISKNTALCTTCWKNYVSLMRGDTVSVDEKIKIHKLFTKTKK